MLQLNLKRLEQVKQVARIRYANNAAGYVDYLNAQVAQSSAQNDAFTLERQYENGLKSINTLIGKRRPSAGTAPGQQRDAAAARAAAGAGGDAARAPSVRASRYPGGGRREGRAAGAQGLPAGLPVIGTFNGNNPPLGFRPASYGIEFDIIIPCSSPRNATGG